jgi:potassium-dependent mechanosensitive channel
MVSKVYVQASGVVLAVALGWGVVSATSVGGAPAGKVGLGSLLATAAETNLADGGRAGEGSAKGLTERLAEARANLAFVLAEGTGLTNAPEGIPPQDLSLRRAMCQRLVALYEQQIRSTVELEALKNRKAELARDAQAWTGFSEPRPYSILLADSLREELQAERLNIKSGDSALSVLGQLIDGNREGLIRAEERIRLLNDQIESAKDPLVKMRLAWQREQERLQSQVAGATATGLDLERQLGQERLAQSRIRAGLFQRQLVVADAGARFTQADLDKVLSRIEAERRQRERELAAAETRGQPALRALEAARQELTRLQGLPDAGGAAAARAAEVVELRRAQLEAADTAAQVSRMALEAASLERVMWEQRFAVYGSRSVETLGESERRLETFNRRVVLWREYFRQQHEIATSQAALQEVRVSNLDPASELAALARERLDSLRERDRLVAVMVERIERMERLAQRWEEALADAAGKLPFTGRVRHLFSSAHGLLERFWNFELFTAQDTITVDGQEITGKRSVTVGKLIKAVLILVVGYWITGLIALAVEPVIVKRLKVERNQAKLISLWLRVVLVVCLIVFSLVSVKIPLTVFAFAGGALAIGLGFGTQTLLKNFVSGIIILFERPFRVGDVLDIAGQRGSVTSIGLRASVLQLWDGTETLIPNSTLLENNVTNWTYTNRKVRFVVSVGVAYGSDLRRVGEIMGEVAERHGLVEKDPKPQVLLTEFGDSTVNFELRFWVDVSKANAAQVASDLRLMIAGMFSERGIVIAFPQREIRIDATRPLPVQVVVPSDPRPDQKQAG